MAEGEKLIITTGVCHKCGRTRRGVGNPFTCVTCVKHYQNNLNRRAVRQAKKRAQAGTGETVQEMFIEALQEAMAQAERGELVIPDPVKDEGEEE